MGGFKNQEFNDILKKDVYEKVIDFVFILLEQMKKDLLLQNRKLKNNENYIRTYLVEHYLNNEDFRKKTDFLDLYLLFNVEVPDGYNADEEMYRGRVDIKVFSFNTIISTGRNYYIIECKRLDGSKKLNDLFVSEGICRFVTSKPKYSSFNSKNIMLGFVVKNFNIETIILEIDDIQNKNKDIKLIQNMKKYDKQKEEYYLYRSKYQCVNKQIELSYMFYDLFEVIE